MLIIDSPDIVSLVFDGGYTEDVSGLTLEIYDNATNTKMEKSFLSIIMSTDRFTELQIDWADDLYNGNFTYNLVDYGGNILDKGILKVTLPATNFPAYKENMDEYVIYKNKITT